LPPRQTSNLAPLSNEVLQAGGHGRRDADGSRLQGEVQQAEELVQALAQEVERAQRAAAAARDELASVQQRNRGLEHQWVAASGEANQLRGEKQGLQAALTQVQREARVLAGQLEEARGLVGQLEEAQQAAAAANGMLDSLRSRTAMLEKAWAGSMKDSQVG
jgi:chromosome segregation ATPase